MSTDETTFDILDAIGNTPIVRLKRLAPEGAAAVYAKVESLNPMGSIKDRIAKGMIEDGERRGLIKDGATVIEPTSGNTGVGLAMVCAVKGYRLILTMPDTMSTERRHLLEALGAELIITRGGLGMKGAIDKAEEIAKSTPGSVVLQQFKNPANPQTHELTTAVEIVREFESLDAFVAGVGTGGTITGVGRVLKREFPGIRIVAVEPKESAVLSGGEPGSHRIQGIGAGFVPDTLDATIYESVIKVGYEEAAAATRALARQEGILAGISSGAATYAALKVAKDLGQGKAVLVILPDTGERYLSTDLFEGKSHD
jgi:cysteine synthase A